MAKDQFTVRDATVDDADAIAHVHVEGWRTAYADILPSDFLQGLSTAERRAEWRGQLSNVSRQSFELVAVDDWLEVIGFANGGAQRNVLAPKSGELYAIYVRANMRGKGAGRLLFGRVVEKCLEMGYSGLTVWVLDDNPYRRFYESLGGSIIGNDKVSIGGQSYDEAVYGWSDLQQARLAAYDPRNRI